MTRNKIIGIVVAVVALIVIIGISVSIKRSGSNLNSPLGGAGGGNKPSGPVTQEALPQSAVVIVPGANATSAPPGVAVPTNVSPANAAGTSNFRNFNITIDNNKFIPDTINVYTNDQLVLNFTAVDKNYDFTQPNIGANAIPIPKGTTYKLPMQAPPPAKYIFYCKSCGGPDKGPVGYIVIAPRP